MPLERTAVQRPNGKTYRPRKVAWHAWDNAECWPYEGAGVVVLGTQDVEGCREQATRMVQHWDLGDFADDPRVGWFRDGFRGGERMWMDDPVRGAAGVMWTAVSP